MTAISSDHLSKQIQQLNHHHHHHHHMLLSTQMALCDGMDKALEPFRDEIADLEKCILHNAHTPATTILSRIEKYQHLFNILKYIIRQINSLKIHGCALLQCIHQQIHTGMPEVKLALEKMSHCVHAIFYKQLTSWLLYGQLEDVHKEFFIQKTKTNNNNNNTQEAATTTTTSGVGKKKIVDMWNYDIVVDMLPSYIRLSLAMKILSIGQTIIIFGNDPRQHDCLLKAVEKNENPVWGEKEHEYFGKLQSLQMKAIFDVTEFENTIDELKKCVTKLLWQVAVDDAQLFQQLKFIKDFFLIGRGDLFLDFIKLTSHLLNKMPTSHTSRDVNLAFQMTMRKMMLNDESAMDCFNFALPLPPITETLQNNNSNNNNNEINNLNKERDRDDPIDKQGWGIIVLQYKVVWPLQLLFNPKSLVNYNIIFRFLLRVKKTQINLWKLWSEHARSKNIDIGVLQLRNNLIFILDNLQYYLQVDVLESQYTVMENCIKNTKNFEDIQTAHSIFLANIMSQTFLTGNAENKNPVNNLIRLLLRLCDDFIVQSSMWEVTALLSTEREELKILTDTLSTIMDLLIKTLNRVHNQPSGKHLAQLLLRLDFNRWFSKQM
ncbi:gamma-tubulin complex component 4 isoform X2 [Aphidius gifuensis]|uniref:gamma-tubulin complex component 4 isoform X2 n=1 Tax=Aphidius gifuensis TaxID=684658 RepID=UPI001CDBC9C4|nr:gamma-tubulin complex component 4 isoform X2 [Aphidius gifuensis]